MTVMEAIAAVDNLKHNTYSYEDKVKWLSLLDSRIQTQIIDTHQYPEDAFCGEYDPEADRDTHLIARAPHDEIYLRWLEAQVDYANGEYQRYNNSIDVFNAVWADYVNYYNRTHMPRQRKYKFF